MENHLKKKKIKFTTKELINIKIMSINSSLKRDLDQGFEENKVSKKTNFSLTVDT